MKQNRRTFIFLSAMVFAHRVIPAQAQDLPAVHVIKDAFCSCCNNWIRYLRDDGFVVSVEDRSVEALEAFKRERKIPAQFASCHTAVVGRYTLEGHVPVADIRRLLSQQPEAVGLSVPGMVIGSPGMGPEEERDAYDVVLIKRDGSASIFSSYPAA